MIQISFVDFYYSMYTFTYKYNYIRYSLFIVHCIIKRLKLKNSLGYRTYTMRLVNLESLKVDEILSQGIITDQGGILLRAQSQFKLSYKNRLLKCNSYEVYIDDAISKGIMPNEVIASNVRKCLNQHLSTQFTNIEKLMTIDVFKILPLASAILEELSHI